MTHSVIRACSRCGASNRVPAKNLADTGRCGACKAELPATSHPIDVDAAAFTDIVQSSRVPVLVDFWASWCGPCRMAAPEVHAVAEELAGRALVLKVDTDANPELAMRYGARSIPHFVVLRGGQVAHQQSGLVPRSQLRFWLEHGGS